jgi:hypothetical protein
MVQTVESGWIGKSRGAALAVSAPDHVRFVIVMSPQDPIIPPQRIEKSIFLIRGQKVMLDADLAELYQVSTKVLNQAVKRNEDRFPADFMFQLTDEEFTALRSQITKSSRNGSDKLPRPGAQRRSLY